MPLTEDEWTKLEASIETMRNNTNSENVLRSDVMKILKTYRRSHVEDALDVVRDTTRKFALAGKKQGDDD